MKQFKSTNIGKEVRKIEQLSQKDIQSRTAIALINFLERAVKEHATPEEIKIIPDVARVLLDHPIHP